MSRTIITTLLFISFITRQVGTVDNTLQERAIGDDVVKATIDKIMSSGIFPDDKRLLRRIAFVESKDGKDKNTFRTGYYGGIWQVDEIGLKDTQDIRSHPGLKTIHEKIKDKFGIDWLLVKKEDLLKPFYSGLAARLKLVVFSESIPRSIEGQAEYWKKHYNTEAGAGTVEKFKNDVKALEQQAICTNIRADIIFCLDGSGSIGSGNFRKMLDFVQIIVGNLSISAKKVRIGVIKFSSNVTVEFRLGKYENKSEIVQAIGEIVYRGGGTQTWKAIDEMISQLRTGRKNVLSLGIVITDGRSNNPTMTAAAAGRAHTAGLAMHAIHIGSTDSTTESELLAIAKRTENMHDLSSFSSLDFFIPQMQESACKSISVIENLSEKDGEDVKIIGSTNAQSPNYYSTPLPRIGATLQLSSLNGPAVFAHVSESIRHPNSAVYDYEITSTNTGGIWLPPRIQRVRRDVNANNTGSQTDMIYISVVGSSNVNSDYRMVLTTGNHVPTKENPAPTPENPAPTTENLVSTTENPVSTTENPVSTIPFLMLVLAVSIGIGVVVGVIVIALVIVCFRCSNEN